jgi:hypothetical protein
VGLAGVPEVRETFVVFVAEGARVYLAQELWQQVIADEGRLRVRMPGYGDACFRFVLPSTGTVGEGAGEYTF